MLVVRELQQTTNKNFSVRRTKENRLMLVSIFGVCGKKKSRFIINQEAIWVLRKLAIRTPLSNIPLNGDILF